MDELQVSHPGLDPTQRRDEACKILRAARQRESSGLQRDVRNG